MRRWPSLVLNAYIPSARSRLEPATSIEPRGCAPEPSIEHLAGLAVARRSITVTGAKRVRRHGRFAGAESTPPGISTARRASEPTNVVSVSHRGGVPIALPAYAHAKQRSGPIGADSLRRRRAGGCSSPNLRATCPFKVLHPPEQSQPAKHDMASPDISSAASREQPPQPASQHRPIVPFPQPGVRSHRSARLLHARETPGEWIGRWPRHQRPRRQHHRRGLIVSPPQSSGSTSRRVWVRTHPWPNGSTKPA